ncbi:TIGR01621 family pseudouridine synthase [Thalassotalea euphylliae]|uniref:TIGR01621 family pseudouridine synthase n=1 Tax=Thalassotalea euphylliae TaxID=1655234 RepID=UPI003624C97E
MTDFTVIDQQPDFLVVDKHPNTNFHDEGNLGNGVFNQVKRALSLDILFPVHRLDKLTSGLLIFAKTEQAAQDFQKQFSNHDIEKYYLALSAAKPKKKQGAIKGDMAKSRRGMWKLLRTNDNPAITQFFSYSIEPGARAFVLKPHSGKTHQIRVAMNSIGAPILGDELYGGNSSDRGYLHAYAMRFTLFGKPYEYILPPRLGSQFTAPIFVKWLEHQPAPWQQHWPKKP